MMAKTILQVGYRIDQLKLKIDHKAKCFQIQLTDAPRLMDVLLRDYIVKSVSNTVVNDCDPKNYLAKTESVRLPHRKINRMYKRNRPAVKSLEITTSSLNHDQALKKLIPILKKIMEPSIALFYSCYSVQLEFGGNRIEIISSPCTNQLLLTQKS